METELIYRKDAKDFVRHAYYKGLNPIEYLDEVPAADAVEVVRCKDCKWYMESKYTPPIRFCYRLKDSNGNPVGYNFAESDFCSYAERI